MPSPLRRRLRHGPRLAFILPLSISLASLPALSNAYSWQFNGTPTQCSNVSISITGSGGTAPYTMLMIPSGPSPYSNGSEIRRIQSFDFDGTSLTFDVNYPENTEFVVVVRVSPCSSLLSYTFMKLMCCVYRVVFVVFVVFGR